MAQVAHRTSQALDLGQVLRSIGRRLPRILIGSLLVGGVTAGVLSTMAPKYLSQAQLEIRGGSQPDAGGPPDKEAVGTHVRALMSTDLALKVAADLKLTQRPDFNSALEPPDLFSQTLRKVGVGLPKAGETDEDRLLQAYYKVVRAYQVRETRSVIVDCTTSDATFSASCANRLVELYRDSLRGRAVGENDDFRTKLAPQVERLTQEVAAVEAQVTEFRGQANLFQSGGTQASQLKEQQLGELTAELTRAATARAEADARAASAREMLTKGMAGANPDVQKSTLVPRLEESRVRLERQVSELSATLLPGHPRMKQLSSELASLQRQIRDEVQKVVESLSNDARIAVEREVGVRRRIEEMKKTVVSSATDTAKLAQLEAVARAKRSELERVQKQFETAQSTAKTGAIQPSVEIVSRAYASNEKVFPKVGTMAPFAALAALMLGLAWSFMREIAMSGSRSGAPAVMHAAPVVAHVLPVTPIVESKVAADLPVMPAAAHVRVEPEVAAAVRAQPVVTDQVAAPVIEAVAVLIGHAKAGSPFRTFVTGFDGSTDARGEALDLVRALAASGRESVLVNWAGGEFIEASGAAPSAPGAAELLIGAATLEDAISVVSGSTARFIGPGRDSAIGGIDGEAACVLLDALDDQFEHVVVYAPHARAQELFAAIEGRCDAGVVVLSSSRQGTVKAGQFLGYDVPDFLVVPVVRGQRMAQRVGAVQGRGFTSSYGPIGGRA